MSYYYRDSRNIVHNDKDYPYKYVGQFYTALCPSVSSVTGTPYIAVKDATLPVYYSKSFSSYDDIKEKVENDELDYSYHRCIFVGSYQSRSNQYTLTFNNGQPTCDFKWKNSVWTFKELYRGDKPIISYVDLNKGNMLNYGIKPEEVQYLEKYYRHDDDVDFGPTPTDAPGHNFLFSNNVSSWLNKSYGKLWTDLNNRGYSALYFINEPYNVNTNFGYTFHPNNQTEENAKLSYFTLDVNDIKSSGFSKLRLKYFWNVLFADKTFYSIPYDTLTGKFNSQSVDRNAFIYNYHFSNDATWEPQDEYFCYNTLGDNPNMKSSIIYYNDRWRNDFNVNWNGVFNKYRNYESSLDKWGEVETYNHFYVTWANNQNETTYENADSVDSEKIIVYGDNGKKCVIPMGILWRVNLTAAPSDPSTDYYQVNVPKDTSAKIYDRDNQVYVIAKAKKEIKTTNTYKKSDWEIIPSSIYKTKDPQHKYNITTGWISAQNESNWGQHSAVFMPYIDCNDNACHWKTSHNSKSFNQQPYNGSLNEKYKIWDDFNDDYYVDDYVDGEEIHAKYVRYNGILFSDTTVYDTDGKLSYQVNGAAYGYASPIKKDNIYQNKANNKFYMAKQDHSKYEFYYTGLNNYWNDPDWFYPAKEAADVFNPNLKVPGEDVYWWYYAKPIEEFDTNKNYADGDIVSWNNKNYIAKINVLSGYQIDSNPWNPSYYTLKYLNDNYYDYRFNEYSYNYTGSSFMTIDLADVTERYIHISNPCTYLFQDPLGNSIDANPFITDFKMIYEGVI